MIIDEKLGGIQLFADNSWESQIHKRLHDSGNS